MENILEKITSLAKRRGFIYPGSEIYGGLSGTWDYGPMGVELKRNIKQLFWRSIVQQRDNIVGIDTAILMHPRVWEASGHVENFTDPLRECSTCKKRFRTDALATEKNKEGLCPSCNAPLGETRQFNLLMETSLGAVENGKQKVYLRGEITQGVHVNFKQVMQSSRVTIPFGVAQIGKAFRNEITPGQLSFRSREFEQMELQFYIQPNKKEATRWFDYWKQERMSWYQSLGLSKKLLRFREHKPNERAHYAQSACDIEFKLGNEWKEMEGIHNRGDWDLRRHQEYSGEDMRYFDPESKEKYIPWVIETSGGVDRAALFFLADAYSEEKTDKETRIVLKLHPQLAPYKVAIFPLLSNKPELVTLARSVYDNLKAMWMVDWDDRGNIGKRYRYQDEAGTPYCITVDFDSLNQNDVTVRNRDTMKQERVLISELPDYLTNKLNTSNNVLI